VHVPNPGRMEELLVPGATEGWIVVAKGDRNRRTRHDLIAVRHGRTTVSIDTRVANRLVYSALEEGRLSTFGPGPWRPEYFWSGCRWDFATVGADGPPRSLIEVKSSNLKVGRTAFFPDAPTRRGTHHVQELANAARRGIRAGVLFAIQRSDVDRFAPNRRLDPAFAGALDRARRAGVVVQAFTLRVHPGHVEWGGAIPVSDIARSSST
jgi:sugar fermentation stimulation protein A